MKKKQYDHRFRQQAAQIQRHDDQFAVQRRINHSLIMPVYAERARELVRAFTDFECGQMESSDRRLANKMTGAGNSSVHGPSFTRDRNC